MDDDKQREKKERRLPLIVSASPVEVMEVSKLGPALPTSTKMAIN